jgi:hypothetical protein
MHSTRSASDKVYQLLAHGRWFSPGTPASSTTKTGRYDIAEILLKVVLNTKNKKKIKKNRMTILIYLMVSSTVFPSYSTRDFVFILAFLLPWRVIRVVDSKCLQLEPIKLLLPIWKIAIYWLIKNITSR